MPRELYGIAEIAEALGLTRQAVTVWRRRASWGMPEPDVELSSGPVWRDETIEPWLVSQRARLAGEVAAAPLTTSDIRRTARRLLRLLLMLLEDSRRPNLLHQALTELDEQSRYVTQAAGDDTQADLQRVLAPVTTLMAEIPDPSTESEALVELIRRLADGLPELRKIILSEGVLDHLAGDLQ